MIVMGNIKIWRQVGIIAIAFLIPIVFLSFFVIENLNKKILQANLELKGTKYLSQAYRLFQELQNHRGEISLFLINHDASSRSSLNQKDADIDRIFQELHALDEKFDNKQNKQLSLKEIYDKWSELKIKLRSMSNFEAIQTQTKFISESVIPFMNHIADITELNQDPDLEAYYVINILENKILFLEESLGRLRAYGTNALTNEKVNLQEQPLMNFLDILTRADLLDFESSYEQLINIAPSNEILLQPTFKTASSNIRNYINYFNNVVLKGNLDKVTPLSYVNESNRVINSIYNYSSNLLSVLESILKNRISTLQNQKYLILMGVGISILIAVSFCLFVIRSIKRLVIEVSSSFKKLISSISDINDSLVNIRHDVVNTAAALSQVSASVEQVTRVAEHSLQNAQSVLKSTENVVRVSQVGRKITHETVEGMNDIQSQVNDISENMVRLNNQSTAIGSIIISVEDLARQSSLLALNASLEAVKAGEQGKGFDVVAQEINRLAKQSKQAIERIRTILEDIKTAIQLAVQATDSGRESVVKGVDHSVSAGRSFDELEKSIIDAKSAVNQIVNSSQQQFLGIEQVVKTLRQIKESGAKNVEGIKGFERAAQTLTQVSLSLKNILNQHKL